MIAAPTFRIVPLPYALVKRVRRTLRDDHGHALEVITNRERGNPCRFTLRQSPPGEELILMSYSPFRGGHPYAEVGPIFIRKNGDADTGYADPHRWPPEIDPVNRVFRCYDADERIVDARVGTSQPEALIAELFANAQVQTIHVRSLTYGCYTFKIERA
jgi:hypothetical protein